MYVANKALLQVLYEQINTVRGAYHECCIYLKTFPYQEVFLKSRNSGAAARKEERAMGHKKEKYTTWYT